MDYKYIGDPGRTYHDYGQLNPGDVITVEPPKDAPADWTPDHRFTPVEPKKAGK